MTERKSITFLQSAFSKYSDEYGSPAASASGEFARPEPSPSQLLISAASRASRLLDSSSSGPLGLELNHVFGGQKRRAYSSKRIASQLHANEM